MVPYYDFVTEDKVYHLFDDDAWDNIVNRWKDKSYRAGDQREGANTKVVLIDKDSHASSIIFLKSDKNLKKVKACKERTIIVLESESLEGCLRTLGKRRSIDVKADAYESLGLD